MLKKLFVLLMSFVMLLAVCPAYAAADIMGEPGDIEVGDLFVFGSYEQDGKKQNGAEAIEWIVLDKTGDSILVVSRYILDHQQYNEDKESTTWEESDLREWLNDEFINKAFTEEEREYILTTELENEDNPKNGTPGGYSTEDKIFILSESDVEYYMEDKEDRFCKSTKYAEKHGVYVNHDNGGGSWWALRTPGVYTSYVCYVSSGGGIQLDGRDVNETKLGVRPAMYVDISSLI